jgi:hypothetical protein
MLWKAAVLPAIRGALLEGFLDGSAQAPPKEVEEIVADKTIKSMTLVWYILAGLGPEYDSVVSSVIELYALLLNYEQRQELMMLLTQIRLPTLPSVGARCSGGQRGRTRGGPGGSTRGATTSTPPCPR